jgi:dipeptide/tripeptide permease
VTRFILFLALAALSIEIGRYIAVRILGEREMLTAGGLSIALGVACAGFLANVIWRATRRVDLAMLLLLPALIAARVLLGRWPLQPLDGPPALTARARALACGLSHFSSSVSSASSR